MCFNRRRNIFTLGDFYQKTKPATQVRTSLKDRQKADVFERDPFKVQSYNFHYAERPSQSTNYCYHNQLNALKESQAIYLYKNGMSHTRFNENSNKTNKLYDIQRYKNTAPQRQPSNEKLLCNPSSVAAGSQQRSDTTSRYNETDACTFSELSSYGCRERTTECCTKRTTVLSSPYKRQSSAIGENARNTHTPLNCFPENGDRMSNADKALRGRLYARETSKAVAEAVGTVGCPYVETKSPTTTKANGRFCPQSVNGILRSLDTQPFRCRRSIADTEIGAFSTCSSLRTGQTSSNTMLRKNSVQPMQQGHRLGTMFGHNDQWAERRLQKTPVRNMVTHSIYADPQTRQSGNICITIKGTQKQRSNESLIIKIESATPIKVTKSVSASHCAIRNKRNEPATQCGSRWNNLTTQKTKICTPRGCNVTSKSSADAINLNRGQSKYSLSDEDNSLHQRIRVCERFFEREDNRLRELAAKTAKLDNIGHTLGQGTSKELKEKRASSAQTRQQAGRNISSNENSAVKTRRLQSIYEKGLTSLRQLRASIGPSSTGRGPRSPTTLPQNQLNEKTSTTTFTVPRSSVLRAHHSISQISMTNGNNDRKNHLNTTVVQPSARSIKGSKEKSCTQMNVNINLFPERRKKSG